MGIKTPGAVIYFLVFCSPVVCTTAYKWEQLWETSTENRQSFYKTLAVESLPLPNQPRLVLIALSQRLQQGQVSTGKLVNYSIQTQGTEMQHREINKTICVQYFNFMF